MQNLAQLKALFEKQWESIVGNCDEFLYLGGNEQSTHKYVSELLGKETTTATPQLSAAENFQGRNTSTNSTLGTNFGTSTTTQNTPLSGFPKFSSVNLDIPDFLKKD